MKVVTADDLSLLATQAPLIRLVVHSLFVLFFLLFYRSGFGVEVEVKMMSDNFGGLFFLG